MTPIKGRVVIDCWDDGGDGDRYSIAITGLMEVMGRPYTYWLGASANPFHPQGVGQHGGEIETEKYNRNNYKNLGRPIDFLDLPADVQRFVRGELQTDPENNRVRDVIQQVRDFITGTPEFDADIPFSGAELVDFVSAWRANAMELLRLLDRREGEE